MATPEGIFFTLLQKAYLPDPCYRSQSWQLQPLHDAEHHCPPGWACESSELASVYWCQTPQSKSQPWQKNKNKYLSACSYSKKSLFFLYLFPVGHSGVLRHCILSSLSWWKKKCIINLPFKIQFIIVLPFVFSFYLVWQAACWTAEHCASPSAWSLYLTLQHNICK